jgi:hypothetical protein
MAIDYAIGRRSNGRLRLGLEGSLELVCGRRKCTVVDLSASGAQLRLRTVPRLGECGLLKIDRVDAFGEIVWHNAHNCGLKFDVPLNAQCVLDFRQRCEELLWREQNADREYAQNWVDGSVR